jgi:hypothetical protein
MIDFREHCPNDDVDQFAYMSEALVKSLRDAPDPTYTKDINRQLEKVRKSLDGLGREASTYLSHYVGWYAMQHLRSVLEVPYKRRIKGDHRRAALVMFAAQYFESRGGKVEGEIESEFFAYVDDLVDAVAPEPRWNTANMIREYLEGRFSDS